MGFERNQTKMMLVLMLNLLCASMNKCGRMGIDLQHSQARAHDIIISQEMEKEKWKYPLMLVQTTFDLFTFL